MKNPPYATGYWHGEDGGPDSPWQSNDDWLGVIGSAAGGGYATAPDVLKFTEALRKGPLLKPATRDLMWRDITVGGRPTGCGFLTGIHEMFGHRMVGHTGGAPGVNAVVRLFPELGYAVIVMSNMDTGARPTAMWIEELIAKSLVVSKPDS